MSFSDVIRGSAGANPDQNTNIARTALAGADSMGRPWDKISDKDQAVNVESPLHYDPTCSEWGLQQLTGNSDMVLNDIVATNVGDLEAEAHASLNPDWMLPLDGFAATTKEPFPEPQSQTYTDATVPDIDFSTPFGEQSFYSVTDHTYATNCDTKGLGTALSPAATSFATLTSEDPHSATLAKTPPSIPVRTSDQSDAQNLRRSSKRKRLSSLLARKKRHMTIAEPPETDEEGTQDSPLTIQAPTHSISPPSRPGLPARSNTKVHPLAANHQSNIFKTDWVADWEGVGRTGAVIDGGSAVRDVNIADCSRRPVSWPRRHHFRRSLDISVAVLTKAFEKKSRIEDGKALLPAEDARP